MQRYVDRPIAAAGQGRPPQAESASAQRGNLRPRPPRARAWPGLWIVAGWILLAGAGAGTLRAAGFSDLFAGRELLTDASGQLDGSNVGAGVEAGEPRHGGKTGGRSVWVSWLAPADGVATFETGGSSYDTLLSAYYFAQPADTTLDKLREAARNDDAPGAEPSSLIQFGARAGITYHLAVDGFQADAGSIRLRWDFVAATSPPPVIVSVSGDQAVRQGDTVTLAVDMQAGPELDLQWRLNGQSFGATGPTLVLPNVQPTNLGLYTLRIRIGDVRFETTPTELQINSEGQTNALARDKVLDAVASALTPGDAPGLFRQGAGLVRMGDGVSRGYQGTQIFNTTYATADAQEPVHCSFAPAATYWFSYQPPADGTLVIETSGSSFDTFAAAYTFNPPLTDYDGLVPIGCDDNGAGGLASRLEFATPKDRPFLVVVGGINGARGIVQLHYVLDTNRPPQAPSIQGFPADRVVAAGSTVVLGASVTGSPPVAVQWYRNLAVLDGQTSSLLQLSPVTYLDEGTYSVQISSYLGRLTSPPCFLRVVLPPVLLPSQAAGLRSVSLVSRTGQLYQLEVATNLLSPDWQPAGEPVPGDGSLLVLTQALDPVLNGFYRVQVR